MQLILCSIAALAALQGTNQTACPPGANCTTNGTNASVTNITNTTNPCNNVYCPNGTHCVVDTWGYARCANNSNTTNPCNNVNCPNGTHCVVDTWGYARCANNSNTTNPCNNVNCPNGTHCVVDTWGYARCAYNSYNGKDMAGMKTDSSASKYSKDGTERATAAKEDGGSSGVVKTAVAVSVGVVAVGGAVALAMYAKAAMFGAKASVYVSDFVPLVDAEAAATPTVVAV
eukprot:TRINITY_DN282_c0_g1_i1.p1 TRINITY_DN282_c0_g1~~TRINITY_DN282_c0_g1_i1.p1  ORF type:complete len:230 (+),score=45.96 TRINITY_DN282_c0_g1_i1:56-745(+)